MQILFISVSVIPFKIFQYGILASCTPVVMPGQGAPLKLCLQCILLTWLHNNLSSSEFSQKWASCRENGKKYRKDLMWTTICGMSMLLLLMPSCKLQIPIITLYFHFMDTANAVFNWTQEILHIHTSERITTDNLVIHTNN